MLEILLNDRCKLGASFRMGMLRGNGTRRRWMGLRLAIFSLLRIPSHS